MLTVEQLRAVRPDQIAALASALRSHAERIGTVVSQTVESASRDLTGWRGQAAVASTAHRYALADNANRLSDAHTQASTVISSLAGRLDEARQLLDLADSFAGLVGCQVNGRAEVTVLPPTMLGPLDSVYDSVRRTAGALAAQALVVAEAADLHASRALGGPGLPTAEDVEPQAGHDGTAGTPGAELRAASGGSLLASITGPDSTGPDIAGPEDADAPDGGPADAERLDDLVDRYDAVADLVTAVTAFYSVLPTHRRRAVRRDRATLVASLPGAPVPERFAANRSLVEQNRAALRECRSQLAGTPAEHRSVANTRTLDAVNQRIGTLNSFLASRTIATIDPETGERRNTLYERQFLAFDPSGAGQCAEVFGDLATAQHVAVLIPGGRNGLDTFNALATDARLLADTAGPGCAVVAWLGYDSVGAGTASSTQSNGAVNAARARAGASALRRFLAGLAPALPPSARVVLVGHGFGTVLVAAALRAGHQPDGVVLVGSPGLGPRIRTVADLRPAQPGGGADLTPGPVLTAPAGPRCWAVRAPGDAVAYSRAFGPDPAEFPDIVRMETQGGAEVVGHSRYYAVGSESLDNLARVVSGRLDEVTGTDTTLDEELMLVSLDDPACEGPPPVPPAPVVVLDGVLGAVGAVGDTLAAARSAEAAATDAACAGDGADAAEWCSRRPHGAGT